MSTVAGASLGVVIAVAGGVLGGGCCLYGVYYLFTRVLIQDRRSAPKKPLHIEVYIEPPKVIEEEVIKGPERVLSKQEKKKLREQAIKKREREEEIARRAAERPGTADTADSVDGEGKGSPQSLATAGSASFRRWLPFFSWSVVAKQDSHHDVSIDLEAGSVSEGVQMLDDGNQPLTEAEVDPQSRGKKKKKKKGTGLKERPESESIKRVKDAEAKRIERREEKERKEREIEKAQKHAEMLARETPEERHARLEKHRLEKEAKEEAALQEMRAKRKGHIKEGLAIFFNRRRSSVIAPTVPQRVCQRDVEEENSVGLFDLNFEQKGQDIMQARLTQRMNTKMRWLEEGLEDCVLVNSGPPMSIIPEGKIVSPVIPSLKPEDMQHKKVMVLFEERRATGWFQGVVSNTTKRPGFNFNVKFAKEITANIDVDGIKACRLYASGEHAYGRSWVMLLDDPTWVQQDHGSRLVTPRTQLSTAEGGTRPNTAALTAVEAVDVGSGRVQDSNKRSGNQQQQHVHRDSPAGPPQGDVLKSMSQRQLHAMLGLEEGLADDEEDQLAQASVASDSTSVQSSRRGGVTALSLSALGLK